MLLITLTNLLVIKCKSHEDKHQAVFLNCIFLVNSRVSIYPKLTQWKISQTKYKKKLRIMLSLLFFPMAFVLNTFFLSTNSQYALSLPKMDYVLYIQFKHCAHLSWILDNCVWLTNYITAVSAVWATVFLISMKKITIRVSGYNFGFC